jgi:deazaflavin-dependent oxidoreductase (nitroreductase family)
MGWRQTAVNVIRKINKYSINRVMVKIAGVPHSPISIVRHTGRRTGRAYATPVIAEPLGGGLVIAFTYGPEVDWYRNILARGSCVIRRGGVEYPCADLKLIDGKAALPAFPFFLRSILRIAGTSKFLRLEVRK